MSRSREQAERMAARCVMEALDYHTRQTMRKHHAYDHLIDQCIRGAMLWSRVAISISMKCNYWDVPMTAVDHNQWNFGLQ